MDKNRNNLDTVQFCPFQNDYAARRLYLLVNLCEEGVPRGRIQAAINGACTQGKTL